MGSRNRRSGVVGGKPDELLQQLTRIADALEALVMLNVPEPQHAPVCEHEWVDLGGEKECLKCKTRQ